MSASSGSWVAAHSPVVDANLKDWCVGATSNTTNGTNRVENSSARLDCGTCSDTTTTACETSADCPGGEDCLFTGTHGVPPNPVLPNAKTELTWWDNRTDGAVNDLGTVAMTWDATNLYVGAELWVDPDPASLPFGEIAIDFKPGGVTQWHDPTLKLTDPGTCSVSTNRACTTNADCHFCGTSDEPTGGCSGTPGKSCVTAAQCPVGESCIHRVRTCGSACDAGDTCNTSQTCVGLGAAGRKANIGQSANPVGRAEFLLVFDFSFWLSGTGDSVQLMRPRVSPPDPVDPANPWVNITGCVPDFTGDTTDCDFAPAVNPGQSGGSGGPPGSVEVGIPWAAFRCANCPGWFGPDVPFRFAMTVARGNLAFPVGGLDFKPDGAHEDVLSESVAGTTSTTSNSCPGMGIGTTFCELADGSADAFVPGRSGRVDGLTATKAGSAITLAWNPSCSTSDTTYEIYEGAFGSWSSHGPVTCSTSGATSATVTPASGNRYFLIVPRGAANEGSYGSQRPTPATVIDRPASTSACLPQLPGLCD